jgi:hypothetical protein
VACVITKTLNLLPCLTDKIGTVIPKLSFANRMARHCMLLHKVRRKKVGTCWLFHFDSVRHVPRIKCIEMDLYVFVLENTS